MKSDSGTRPYGVEERIEKRRNRINAIQKQVDELLDDYLPDLKNSSSDTDRYDGHIQRLNQELEKLFPRFADFREGRNHLSRKINEGNINDWWSLPVPEYLIRVTRPRPLRTNIWFKRVRMLNRWKVEWHRHLGNRTVAAEPVKEEQRLACCLISAAINGGLCIPEALLALANQLKTQERPFQGSGELVWIDLVFSRDSEALNFEVDGEPVTLRRWYPDTLTLGVIGCYLKERELDAPRKKDINSAQVWNQVKSYAKSIYHEKGIRLFEIGTFCRAAIGVTERLPGIRLSQALVEYSIGRISCASIPPENQRSIVLQSSFPRISCSMNDFKTSSVIPTSKKKTRKNIDCNFEKLISSIRQALGLKISYGEKNTRKKAAKKLQQILEVERLPEPAYLLVDWLYSLLYLEKNTVSTAMRYFSAVGKSWLSATVSIEFEDFDESDFEELYLGILDAEMSEKSRRYNASRLRQLHAHGVTKLGFSPLIDGLGVGLSKSQPTVRAAYLSEQQFIGLRESVENIDGLDEQTRQGLVCLLIIGFRTGLRRGELLKLRVCDVEKSVNRWIFIRNNRFGDNKSSSALRKIPLAIFLTPDEKKYFNAYFSRREAYGGAERNTLLFSMPMTPQVSHDGNMISGLTRYILKSLTGFDYTFHHLRHTAISRIYAVLVADDELISVVSPYSREDALKLRKAIHNIDEDGALRDIYWSLSALAGHSSPETTFSNYIHFCDKALGGRLRKTTACFSKAAIAEMTGLTANKLTRICKQHAITGDSIPVQMLEREFLENIKPYRELITQHKGKKSLSCMSKSISKPENSVAVTIDQCHAVLRDAEKGMALVELSMNYQIPEIKISQWVRNARYLSSLTTKADRKRLYSASRKTVYIGEVLVPPRPNSNAERIQVNKAVDVLRVTYQANKAEVEWSIRYYFENSHASRAGIEFSDVGLLTRFIAIYGSVFPLKSWRLYYYPLRNADHTNVWRQATEGIAFEVQDREVSRVSRFPYGKAVLYLSHPKEDELLKKDNNVLANKYSSSAIRFVIHMLAIMLLKAG